MTTCNRQHAEVIEARRIKELQAEWQPVADATGALIVEDHQLEKEAANLGYRVIKYVKMCTAVRHVAQLRVTGVALEYAYEIAAEYMYLENNPETIRNWVRQFMRADYRVCNWSAYREEGEHISTVSQHREAAVSLVYPRCNSRSKRVDLLACGAVEGATHEDSRIPNLVEHHTAS